LIALLDPQAVLGISSATKEQVQPYVIRTEKRRAIDTEGRPLFQNRRKLRAPVLEGAPPGSTAALRGGMCARGTIRPAFLHEYYTSEMTAKHQVDGAHLVSLANNGPPGRCVCSRRIGFQGIS